jgi:hypothetical protein
MFSIFQRFCTDLRRQVSGMLADEQHRCSPEGHQSSNSHSQKRRVVCQPRRYLPGKLDNNIEKQMNIYKKNYFLKVYGRQYKRYA